MTGRAHDTIHYSTYTKLMYALRITSLQSGRVKKTSFSRFSVDLRCIFLMSVFLSGSSKVAEYARPSCVSVAFTVSEVLETVNAASTRQPRGCLLIVFEQQFPMNALGSSQI